MTSSQIRKVLIENSDFNKFEYRFYEARPDKRERELSDIALKLGKDYNKSLAVLMRAIRHFGKMYEHKYGVEYVVFEAKLHRVVEYIYKNLYL